MGGKEDERRLGEGEVEQLLPKACCVCAFWCVGVSTQWALEMLYDARGCKEECAARWKDRLKRKDGKCFGYRSWSCKCLVHVVLRSVVCSVVCRRKIGVEGKWERNERGSCTIQIHFGTVSCRLCVSQSLVCDCRFQFSFEATNWRTNKLLFFQVLHTYQSCPLTPPPFLSAFPSLPVREGGEQRGRCADCVLGGQC